MKFLDNLSTAASTACDHWNQKTPGQKARTITTAAVLTMFNPTLPLLWAGVYTVASVKDTYK